MISCVVQHPPSYVLVENVVGFDKSPMRTQLHDTLALIGLSMQVTPHLSRSKGHLCHQLPIASAALHRSVMSICLICGVASVIPSERNDLIQDHGGQEPKRLTLCHGMECSGVLGDATASWHSIFEAALLCAGAQEAC